MMYNPFSLSDQLYLPVIPMIGQGRKTLYTWHKRVGSSRHQPHQGRQEIARRKAQQAKLEAKRGAQS